MEWKTIRAHLDGLVALAKSEKVTQAIIGERGGLGQNQISEMLKIDKLGPSVENFTRALDGLGVRPSDFFLQIERSQDPSLTAPPRAPKNQDLAGQRSYGEALPDVDRLVDEVLLELASRIAARARSAGTTNKSHRAAARPRTTKPDPRKRRA